MIKNTDCSALTQSSLFCILMITAYGCEVIGLEIQIVPCKEEYVADCVRISVTSYEYIHEQYAKHLGRDLHDAVMPTWRADKAKSIEDQQRGPNAFVALADGEVAGFASFIEGKYYGQVGNNAVDPKFRGNGIAGLLYRRILDGMREKGYQYAMVMTGLDDGHASARRAYGKVGFEKNLPYMTYYQKLEPAEKALSEWDDGVRIVPCTDAHIAECRRICLTAWTTIHEAYKSHLGAALHDAVMPNWKTETPDAVEERLRSGRGYVILSNDEIAGFTSYRPVGHIGQIGYNAVDPKFRGRGLAGRMHAFVLDRMREEGMLYARVQTGLDEGHAPARRAYEKAGFEKYLPSVMFYQAL